MSASRRIICGTYGLIAVLALVATWGPNFDYSPNQFFSNFIDDLAVTPASRSYAGDLLVLAFAAVVYMVIEARKLGIRFVWLYVVGGFVTAIGFTFPLFLIARERRLAASDTPRLRTSDTVLLSLIAAMIACHVIWINFV